MQFLFITIQISKQASYNEKEWALYHGFQKWYNLNQENKEKKKKIVSTLKLTTGN